MFHPVSPAAKLSDEQEAADVFGGGIENEAEGDVDGTEGDDADWDEALGVVDAAEQTEKPNMPHMIMTCPKLKQIASEQWTGKHGPSKAE